MSEPQTTTAEARETAESTRYRIRPGAKALIRSGDRVLLVKERHVDGTPYWTLPGGGVHPTESVPAGLRREITEELRCRPVVAEPVTTAWYAHSSVPNAVSVYGVFECALLSEPRPTADEGILDLRWAPATDLPGATLSYVPFVLRESDRFP